MPDSDGGSPGQVHARLLVSESHFFIKEAYLSLLEAVCTIYVERRRRTGVAHRGLNVGLTETKRALQILAMVNKYQVGGVKLRASRLSHYGYSLFLFKRPSAPGVLSKLSRHGNADGPIKNRLIDLHFSYKTSFSFGHSGQIVF